MTSGYQFISLIKSTPLGPFYVSRRKGHKIVGNIFWILWRDKGRRFKFRFIIRVTDKDKKQRTILMVWIWLVIWIDILTSLNINWIFVNQIRRNHCSGGPLYRLQDKVLLCLPRPDRRKPKNLRRSRQDEKIKIKNNFVKRDRKFTVLLPYNIGLVNMTHI